MVHLLTFGTYSAFATLDHLKDFAKFATLTFTCHTHWPNLMCLLPLLCLLKVKLLFVLLHLSATLAYVDCICLFLHTHLSQFTTPPHICHVCDTCNAESLGRLFFMLENFFPFNSSTLLYKGLCYAVPFSYRSGRTGKLFTSTNHWLQVSLEFLRLMWTSIVSDIAVLVYRSCTNLKFAQKSG